MTADEATHAPKYLLISRELPTLQYTPVVQKRFDETWEAPPT